jgi:hypothetical protein
MSRERKKVTVHHSFFNAGSAKLQKITLQTDNLNRLFSVHIGFSWLELSFALNGVKIASFAVSC